MTTPTLSASPTVSSAPSPPRRSVELILARSHLRLGSLALARVELETLAGLGRLDAAGLVDLAEVRWRTGDLGGAGEAAAAALRMDERLPVALIIAAEAAAAIGRPSESRRLAGKAVECLTDPIDAIFAGMPRSGAWPADAAEPPPTAGTLFHQETAEPDSKAGDADDDDERLLRTGGGPDRAAAARDSTDGISGKAAAAPAPGPMTLGFWDSDDDTDPASGELPDPARELEAGRAALVAGKHDEAALRLGLALRLAPALAPVILEATEGARSAIITVLRGDAYRLAGHETEAQRAYTLAAHGGLADRRRRPRRVNALSVQATSVEAVDHDGARRDTEPAPDADDTASPAKGRRTSKAAEPVPPDAGQDPDAAQDDAPA